MAVAAEPWIGRWSIDPQGCERYGDTQRTSPLIVGEKNLRWLDSSCWIGKIYRVGNAAYIQAHCSGKPSAIPISLSPKGDRLSVTWNNAKIEDMRRCR